jgi:ferrochelatase
MKKRALFLLNMGGINSIDEVELFLRNMFADPNILPVANFLRKRIAKRIIDGRLEEVKENYRQMGGKSPLTEITQSLARKLEALLEIPVFLAMRYVPPFTKEALQAAQAQGIEEIVLFPMYPQYSTTTTKSSVDDVYAQAAALGYAPTFKTVPPYFDRLGYIELCARRIEEACEGIDTASYELILSAHGLPQRIVKKGDPYEKQIQANVSALKLYLEMQGVAFRDIKLAYQSKVGKGKWLEPALDATLRNPTHRRVVIYPLSFTVDNSETLFELDREHRDIAEKLHYEDYRVARCFNDDDAHAKLIVELVKERLAYD